jgi:CBS domain-containing protein
MRVESLANPRVPLITGPQPLSARGASADIGVARPFKEHEELKVNDLRSLAVMQNRELIGILSERDVVQAVAAGISPSRARVRQYMTDHPATANLEEDSSTLDKRMIDLGVRHLPVVDSRRLVGVVSARDLLNLEAWNS